MHTKSSLYARFLARLDIPREALPGSYGLTVSGREEVTIRGCKKILRYSPAEISLKVGKSVLTVTGERLLCVAFGVGHMTITGKIGSILFLEEEK